MSASNENFALLVDAACGRFPARPALFFDDGGRSISYRELAGLVDGWATALRLFGAGPGRSVAL